jgi:hypothetical protein
MSLENGESKGPLQLRDSDAIGDYFVSEMRKAYANCSCDCHEELAYIDRMVFSQNSLFLLVITKSLYAWILNTVNWNIEEQMDLKNLSCSLDAEEEYLKVQG